MKNHILTEIYNGRGQLSSRVQIHDPALEKNIQESFLGRLRHPNIDDQKSRVCGPRRNSFNWLFEPSVDRGGNGTNFRDWAFSSLSSRPTFWITGKPGAGKTVLALEICERLSRQTNVVSFFFVGDGKPIQKGMRGLVQSILWQLLSGSPEMIPIIAPSRWETLALFGEDPKPFDSTELQQMLISTLRQRRGTSRVFIVIDALDEFEGIGGNFEILELLYKITDCPGVKVCISSRPLPYLQSLINGAPSLVLENCNSQDMEEFVTSKIEAQISIAGDSFIGLGVKEQLIHELTTKAEGCFLWAVLVLESLGKLFTDINSDDELFHFVNNIPTGLTELFRCLLDELDVSQSFVASSVRFIATFDEPVSPLRLSFMEMAFPDFALHQNISSFSQEDLNIRSREAIERIVGGSRGLLRLVAPPRDHNLEAYQRHGRIIPIHRTLKEFIRTDTVGGSQSAMLGLNDFAARYSAASLAILKTSPIGEFTVQSVSAEAIRCSYTAMFVQTENEVHISRILDELEWTCHVLLDTLHPMQSSWTNSEPDEFAYNFMPIQQSVKEHKFWHTNNFPVPQSEKMPGTLRMRAGALVMKYHVVRWADLQRMIFHPPHFHCHRAGYKWDHCLWNIESDSPMFDGADSGRGQNYATPLREIERKTTSNTDNEMNGVVYQGDIAASGESDSMSCESWSSVGLSLDDAHPLMAFKDEVTDAVFQGYMEYRKRHLKGNKGALEAIMRGVT
ncbi:hypothetical protein RRF57_007388 [Xylaria bambusicola]|uniref:Nephrocystin 3-like N-terminal domain-containing protein n=1 Tax=Xylaria bambusicola TaxID=326684 RepID=A0AAN7UQG0_9PEZI